MRTALRLVLTLTCASFVSAGCDSGSAGDDGTDDMRQEPELGDTPLPACDAAVFTYEQIVAESALPNPDVDYVITLYRGEDPDFSGESPTAGGSALQRWVREVGARLGRVSDGVLWDDAEIESALADATLAADAGDGEALHRALVEVGSAIRRVASLDMRARIAGVADALPDPARDPALLHAEWDTAYCVWSGFLLPEAKRIDADPVAGDPVWETEITDAFEAGHDGIEGDEEAWASDEWATKPAKQIIEKSSFAVAHRSLLDYARTAKQGSDTVAAHMALGDLWLLEDRLRERNTPGMEEIRTMLEGETATIDAEFIEVEMDIAFVKRARKYCDEALVDATSGTPGGLKGAWEGTIYTRVVLPQMQRALQSEGFDATSYMQTWADFRAAVESDDIPALQSASAELVDWNCRFQAALGIESCNADQDEL